MRFKGNNISELDGLAVPILQRWDDTLLVLEMTIVQPPRILDFAKVYFDGEKPPYGEFDEHWHAKIREEFGDNAPRVYRILAILRGFGINYVDPQPGNIEFE